MNANPSPTGGAAAYALAAIVGSFMGAILSLLFGIGLGQNMCPAGYAPGDTMYVLPAVTVDPPPGPQYVQVEAYEEAAAGAQHMQAQLDCLRSFIPPARGEGAREDLMALKACGIARR